MATLTRGVVRKLAALAAIATGLVCVVAVDASASIPASDGTINACYTTSSGALRVIDSAGSCYSYETAISWPGSVPALKYFNGTASVSSSGTTITALCTDGGTPLSLFLGSGLPANEVNFPSLHLNSSSQPDGIQQYVWGFSASLPYTLVCT